MIITVITHEQYEEALAEVERLIDLDPAPGTPEGERLTQLATLIEKFEKAVFPDLKKE